MTQKTWIGSDYVADVLLEDIPDNETELYTRVGDIETEISDARDGELTLLAKMQAQDVILDEVITARDGESTLLAKQQAQDAATASVATEVIGARDGFSTLLAKQQDQDTKIAAAQVLVTTGYPDQTGKQKYSLTTDGVMPYWEDKRVPVYFSYEDRSLIRSIVPDDKTLLVIRSLGLFVYEASSTETDDDETCFATASGRWILEAPHWDIVIANLYPEFSALLSMINSIDTKASFVFGSILCSIATVATVTSTAFSGTVKGADIGDRVIVNPPAALGTDAASTGRLSYHAFVSAKDTVSIYVCNASAATATLNASVKTYWPVVIIKENV